VIFSDMLPQLHKPIYKKKSNITGVLFHTITKTGLSTTEQDIHNQHAHAETRYAVAETLSIYSN
jgi:hypothetical protein